MAGPAPTTLQKDKDRPAGPVHSSGWLWPPAAIAHAVQGHAEIPPIAFGTIPVLRRVLFSADAGLDRTSCLVESSVQRRQQRFDFGPFFVTGVRRKLVDDLARIHVV